jgi:tetratricopeptide (TPR) repeat protein
MAHTPQLHEMLLINHGTTKGFLKWARQLVKDNNQYQIIESVRQEGGVESLNRAVQKASGEIIVVMHNDVAMPADWIKAFKRCFNIVPNIGAVGPMSNRVKGIQRIIACAESDRVEFEITAKAFFEQNQFRRVATGNLSDFCLAFLHELPDRIGYFDEQFISQEIAIKDFCQRATAEGYQNLIAADTYVYHHDRHKVKNSASSRNQVQVSDRKKYKEKWNGTQNQKIKGLLVIQLLAKAEELSQKGQIEPAVEVLLGAIGAQPEDPRIYLGLSELLLAAKKFQDAKEALIEMPPADENQEMRKVQLLAYAEEGLENYKTAQTHIEQVLLMNPDHPPALNLKGILAYRNGKFTLAEKYFKQAIDSDPGYGEPYTNLGMLALEVDRPQDALKLLKKAFRLNPADNDIANNYHSVIGATAEFSKAEVLAREAAALYPDNQKIKYMLIDFLVQQGKYEMAMPEIEDAIIKFGSDNGIINAALKVREKLGPITIQKFSKMASVSVCMIIKDEEKYLARCLASVKPIVDEMIVVDTGSTDRSKEIALTFGAQVYDFEWKNDFAKARNYSISQASGEWILILDGDEVISPLDHEHFSKIVQKTPRAPIAYSIKTRNYNKLANIVGWIPNDGQYPDEEMAIGWLPSEKVRLFFGKDQIWFEGAVHELVDPVLKRNGIEIKKCPIPVHHYGRLDKDKLDRKGEIYFDIGRKKLAAMGDDLNALRELAVQATILEKNQVAFELWQRLLALNPNATLAAIAYVNIGTIYNRQGKFEDALEAGKKAVECDPNLKEARYNQAMAELHCGNASQTIQILEDLLKGFPDYPPAQFILSAAYCCADQKEKGLEGIIKLKGTPMGAHLDIPCLELAQSLIAAGKMEYALWVLGAVIESDIVNPQLLTLFKECLNMKEATQKSSPILQPPHVNFQGAILENLPQ